MKTTPRAAGPTRPPALRVRELMTIYGVSRSTVWRWIDRGLVEVSRVAARTGVRVRLR